MRRLAISVMLLAALGAGTTACSGPPGTGSEQSCDKAVAAAAAIDKNSDTVEDLDAAFIACTTLAELKAAADRYPDAFDGVDPVEFARNRCASAGAPTTGPICKLVAP